MKHRSLISMFSVVVLFSMLLVACTPAAPTTAPQPPQPAEATQAPAAPAATAVPAPTEAPAAAPAVKPSYEEVAFAPLKVEAPDCNYGGNLKSMESTDAATVVFTFCNPNPAFLAKISVPAFHILDTGYLKSIGGDAAKLGEDPVGSGPYMVKEWVRGDHITFVPNPLYWGPAPKNKEFILKWNKEAAARLLDLQSGNVNGIAQIAVDDVPTIEGDKQLKMYPYISNNFLYLGIQNETPPFDNEKVRQAFAMAIDKQRLVDNFYLAGSVAATQFLPPGVKPGFTDGYAAPKYDPALAKQMLTEAGFDFNKEYTIGYAERTRPYFPYPTKIAQDVQAQYAEIGVKIKLNMQEWATYLPRTREGKEELFFLGWNEDYPDATNWYDVFLLGTSKSFGKPFPDIMEGVQKAAALGDAAERQKIYDGVNKLIDQHVPAIVLAHGSQAQAFRADVKGVVIGPYNENFTDMETDSGTVVYSQDGEPVSLYCGDETDGNSFRACLQVFDTLYNFKYGTAESVPSLAEKCVANTDATVWTCTMRSGAKFSNGAAVDATDVVTTFNAEWDYKDPLRKGNTGSFQYFKDFFGPKVLNEPAS